MKDSFDVAMDLLADIVRNPAFAPEEIERQKEQAISSQQVNADDPDYVASALFDRLVYGFHPVRAAGQRHAGDAGRHHARRPAAVPPPVLRPEQHGAGHRRRRHAARRRSRRPNACSGAGRAARCRPGAAIDRRRRRGASSSSTSPTRCRPRSASVSWRSRGSIPTT